MQHKARKRFGQNFLVDQGVIGDIIHCIHPQAGQTMVEIGPGLGALTNPLLAWLGHLHVVEIDRDLIARLQKHYTPQQMTIHGVDALQFDFSSIPVPDGQKLRVVGNLPYNISSPLLFHLANYHPQIEDMTFMLQNEVVERMVASPSTSDYGRLSVMLQYRFVMDKLLDVPPTAFEPAPKVDSAIVRLIPLPKPLLLAHDEALLSKVVQQSFGQRRKTLRNNLRGWVTEEELAQLNIDANARPETLGVRDYVLIANALHEKGGV